VSPPYFLSKPLPNLSLYILFVTFILSSLIPSLYTDLLITLIPSSLIHSLHLQQLCALRYLNLFTQHPEDTEWRCGTRKCGVQLPLFQNLSLFTQHPEDTEWRCGNLKVWCAIAFVPKPQPFHPAPTRHRVEVRQFKSVLCNNHASYFPRHLSLHPAPRRQRADAWQLKVLMPC